MENGSTSDLKLNDSPDSHVGNFGRSNIKPENISLFTCKGLVKKYRGGGGGGPEHFEMWWLENT